MSERADTDIERARNWPEEDERFRAFVTASADVVYRMSPDWREMRQLQGQEFIADTDVPSCDWLEKYIHPADQARVLAAIGEAIRTRSVFALEHRILRVDGTLGWTASRAVPILDAHGEIVEWLGAASDVTRRRETEEALRASEEKYRAVLSSMDEGLMLADVIFDESGERAIDYLVFETNDAFYENTGLPRGIVGKTISEIMGTDDVPSLEIYGEVARTGRQVRFESEVRLAPLTGWYDVFVQRIGEPEQRRVAVMFQDITERKRIEANLALLAALNERLLALSTSAEIIRAFGELLGATLGVTACAFNERIDHDGEVAIADEWHRTPGRSLVGKYDISEYIGPELEQAMAAGMPYVMRDVGRDPRVRDATKFAALGIGAWAMIPLIREGEWRFGLGVYHDRSYDWRDDEIAMLVEATNGIWNKLERLRAEEKLREADRRKDEFLAMLAHELRNPLAPIRNAAEVLKVAGPADAGGRRAREVIERQTQHLSRLVDDLLDVSRITSGKIALRREPVDLATVVARAVETSRPHVDARGHTLTLDVSGEPLRVDGDATRLVQVVSNLLNNAAKYTDEGGRIRIEAARDGEDTVVRVRDDGVGIAAELLPHVFDLFSQADRSLDRSQGGLGIGLTLARRLVELHGGRIEAHSDGVGLGSEFVVRLPRLADRRDAPDAAARTLGATRRGRSLRILVVEDNVDSADMIEILLRLGGHEVRLAHDGPESIEAARAFAPEVVLCDIGLPGMDGYEVVERLRVLPELGRTRFVALSGYGDAESRLRGKEAGFERHLVKPIEPADLEAMLEALGPSTQSS